MSVTLHELARTKFNQYKEDIARMNNTSNVAEKFAVAPAPFQRIMEAYQGSNEFLQHINFLNVVNQSGEKIGLIVGSIASTTDTKVQARQPINVGDTKLNDKYFCQQVNYDVAYRWELLNAWRHHPDFKTKLASMVTKAIALDKITIGFNGTHRADTSDRATYPLLQDVGKGWLQKIRDNAPSQVYSGQSGKITVGANGEFKTLDALVESAIHTIIGEQFRGDENLVAISSRGIVTKKYLPLLDTVQNPTEQVASKVIYGDKKLGTLPPVYPHNFPANTILITTLDNLSIYIQEGTLNRYIQAQPEWDRDVDYQSVNEDYVVEDYFKCALLEGIEIEE